MSYMTKGLKIIKKGIMISGAAVRLLAGIGAAVTLVLSLRKKRTK